MCVGTCLCLFALEHTVCCALPVDARVIHRLFWRIPERVDSHGDWDLRWVVVGGGSSIGRKGHLRCDAKISAFFFPPGPR